MWLFPGAAAVVPNLSEPDGGLTLVELDGSFEGVASWCTWPAIKRRRKFITTLYYNLYECQTQSVIFGSNTMRMCLPKPFLTYPIQCSLDIATDRRQASAVAISEGNLVEKNNIFYFQS